MTMDELERQMASAAASGAEKEFDMLHRLYQSKSKHDMDVMRNDEAAGCPACRLPGQGYMHECMAKGQMPEPMTDYAAGACLPEPEPDGQVTLGEMTRRLESLRDASLPESVFDGTDCESPA